MKEIMVNVTAENRGPLTSILVIFRAEKYMESRQVLIIFKFWL